MVGVRPKFQIRGYSMTQIYLKKNEYVFAWLAKINAEFLQEGDGLLIEG